MLSIIYLIVEKFVIVRDPNFYKKQRSENSDNTLNKDNVIDVEGKYEDEN